MREVIRLPHRCPLHGNRRQVSTSRWMATSHMREWLWQMKSSWEDGRWACKPTTMFATSSSQLLANHWPVHWTIINTISVNRGNTVCLQNGATTILLWCWRWRTFSYRTTFWNGHYRQIFTTYLNNSVVRETILMPPWSLSALLTMVRE